MAAQSGSLVKEAKANGTLRLFSLYTDFPASVCARWAASEIVKMAGPGWRHTSEMWKVDCLTASAPIRGLTALGAAEADVIVIAASSLEHRMPELIEWLDSLAAPASNRPGLLIGLLGDEENRSQELDWMVKQLMRCARQSKRNFFWQWMEKNTMNSPFCLKDNVEDLLLCKLAASSEVVFC